MHDCHVGQFLRLGNGTLKTFESLILTRCAGFCHDLVLHSSRATQTGDSECAQLDSRSCPWLVISRRLCDQSSGGRGGRTRFVQSLFDHRSLVRSDDPICMFVVVGRSRPSRPTEHHSDHPRYTLWIASGWFDGIVDPGGSPGVRRGSRGTCFSDVTGVSY